MSPTTPSTVQELLERNAREAGSLPALLSPGEPPLGHAGLGETARELSSGLVRLGAAPGSTVAVSLPQGRDLAAALLASMCRHAAAPIGIEQTRREVEALLDGLEVAAALVRPGVACALRDVAEQRGLPILETGGSPGPPPPEAASDSRPGSVALVLHTTGTTGRPKAVALTHTNLLHAAYWTARSLGLGPTDRCLGLMPLVHIHGLLGALLASLFAGSSIVCTRRLDPRELLGWASEGGCTWTTGSPAVLRTLLEARGTWPGLRFLRSASAPMPPELALALEERFGVPQIQVYGMTEAYQVAANPLPPGQRRHGSVGLPTGCEVSIRRDDRSVAPPGERGEIAVRGANVFGGYGGRAASERDARLHEDWFFTGDEGSFDEQGYLHVTGRLDERVNRGGEKISPVEVEHVLQGHVDVVQALCFPVPDPALGEELGALVVPGKGATLDPVELRRFASERLSPTKVPRYFWSRDALPEFPGGKPHRLSLSAALGLFPGRAGAVDLSPGARMLDELRALWTQQLRLDRAPGDDERFFDLGGTSLGLVELMVAIERRFGVRLPLATILEAPTLAELAERIRAGDRHESASEIVVAREDFDVRLLPIQPAGSRAPLLFVAPAGGSVLPYYALADRLPRDRPFMGLQIDVHGRRARLDLEIPALAEAFVEGIVRLAPRQPCILGGWSFGALVAWQIGATMGARGMPVDRVIALDAWARRYGPHPRRESLRGLLVNLVRMFRHSKPLLRDALHERLVLEQRGGASGDQGKPRARRLRELLWQRWARDADIAGLIEKDPRLAEFRANGFAIFGNLRHYLRAARLYEPPRQDLRVEVVKALDSSPDPGTLGWEHLSRLDVRAHLVEGNHYTLLSPPHVEGLARTIVGILEERGSERAARG